MGTVQVSWWEKSASTSAAEAGMREHAARIVHEAVRAEEALAILAYYQQAPEKLNRLHVVRGDGPWDFALASWLHFPPGYEPADPARL